jgi:hypothetical protein
MQYITRNLPLTFQIKLSNAEINPYSGTYNFNVRNVQTNQQTVLTLVDISTLKNIYSKFTIDSGTTFGLFTGQNDVSIYDIVSGSTLIAKDRWVVTDTEIDNNIYFMQSDNNPVVYGIYTDAVPFTPIFTLTLLTSGVDVLIKLQQGSPNTESFDIWRKIGTGGTYINIGNDITSFVSYDNILNYNTEYFYKIRAKNTVGYSNFTAEQSINTANITGVTGSSYYTKSEINTYTGQTALLLNSKLNLNIFTGYTGTTVNKSNFNIYTGTTAPNTFLNKTACACDSKLFNAKSSSYYLNTGSTACNSLALCGCVPTSFLGANGCASDSAKLNSKSASYYLNTGSTALCASTAGNALKLNNQSASYYLNTGSTALCATCAIGAKNLCGCVPASFLLSGGTALCATTAGNALCLGGNLANTYLSTSGCACDSKCLGAKLPAYYLNTGSTALCATTAGNALCLGGSLAACYATKALAITGITSMGTGTTLVHGTPVSGNKIQIKSLKSCGTGLSIVSDATTVGISGSTTDIFANVTDTYLLARNGTNITGVTQTKFAPLASPNFTTCTCAPIVCATTCFKGSGAGLTGTAASLKSNDSSCLNGVLAAGYLLSGGTAICATTAGNALCLNGHLEAALSVCNSVCVNGHAEAALSVCNAVCVNGHAEANLSVANSACLGGACYNTYAPLASPAFTTIASISHATNPYLLICKTNATARPWYIQASGDILYIGCTTAASLCIDTTGNGVTTGNLTALDHIATSDCRLKTCIKPIIGALSTVMQLQGVCYELCDDEKHLNQIGLIAQSVQLILPEVVSHGQPNENDTKYGITDDKLGLKYDKLSAVLIEAIKEQQKQIEEQQKQIACLRSDWNYYKNYNC